MSMFLYKEKLLQSSQLRRLENHKYSCQSVSILDEYLQPWWNWLVSKTPLWLAPNLITIIGLVINILTTLILVYYSPDGRQEPPGWACALCGIGLFVYQSLDSIDGKQARRTNSSSPLGELFDHGCDSVSTIFVAISACISCQLGFYPNWFFFQCICAMTLFYCAHWQTYVSGTLRFGKFDVTEAHWAIITIHMVSAFCGPSIWMSKILGPLQLWSIMALTSILGCSWSLLYFLSVIRAGGIGKNGSTVALPIMGRCNWLILFAFTAGFVVILKSYCGAFSAGGVGKNGSTVALPWCQWELKMVPAWIAVTVNGFMAFRNASVIFSGGCGKNGSTIAGTSVISPVIPFSLIIVPAFIIAQKSSVQIFENHPSLYIFAFGMVSAKVTNRLVVAHMTKSEMEYFDWGLIGPLCLFLNQYFNNFLPEYLVLWFCLIWCTVDLIRYSAQVCLEICDHLNIHLFKIPYPPRPLMQTQSTNVFTQHTNLQGNGTSSSQSSGSPVTTVPRGKTRSSKRQH